MAKPKQEVVPKVWRWIVTHMFGQNMGFQALLSEELVAAEELRPSMLPEEFQVTKVTSCHFNPQSGEIAALPFYLEVFKMINPMTWITRASMPYLQVPNKELVDLMESVWMPKNAETVKVSSEAEAKREAAIRGAVQKALKDGPLKLLR